MESLLSRRTALLAIGGTIGIAAVPVAAVARLENHPDAAILAAWKDRQAAALEQYQGSDPAGADDDALDAYYYDLSERIGLAEDRIRDMRARTPEGVAITLWVAFAHTNDERRYDEALARGNYALILAEEDRLDFHARMIAHAIRDLPSVGRA